MSHGVGHSCSSDLTPSLGTSICQECGHKKEKKKRSDSFSFKMIRERVRGKGCDDFDILQPERLKEGGQQEAL